MTAVQSLVAVLAVSNERISQSGEMNADLMSPSGAETHFEKGRGFQSFENFELRNRLGRLGSSAGPKPSDTGGTPLLFDTQIDDASLARNVAVNQDLVVFFHASGPKKALEHARGLARLGENDDATRSLIETVDKGRFEAVFPLSRAGQMGLDQVEERVSLSMCP